MYKKILSMAMALALSCQAWAEDMQTVMSYYQPEMSRGFIFISKVDMTLTLVNAQGQTVVTYPIACGQNIGQKQVKGDHKTPEGYFLLQNIHEASSWGHDFHDGKGFIKHAYGPWFLRLQTGFQGIGIHGTHAPESIGTRATEGCIRLDNQHIAALEPQVALGMPVIIGPEAGVQSLIASHTAAPVRPTWRGGKPTLASNQSKTSPIAVSHKLKVVDGQLDITPEFDLVEPTPLASSTVDAPVASVQAPEQLALTDASAALSPHKTLADEPVTLEPVQVQPVADEQAVVDAQPAQSVAEETNTAIAQEELTPQKPTQPEPRKPRRRKGPVYINPDTPTTVQQQPEQQTLPEYEVVVVEVTQPDGTVNYEVRYVAKQ